MNARMTDRETETTGWEERNTLVYRGSSMHPTFRDLDVLMLQPDATPVAGDVIAYTSPENGRITVHRVVRCSDRGFVTQGDNNRSPDLRPVRTARVLGRVDLCNRDGTVTAVRGGRRGLAVAWCRHLTCLARFIASVLAGPVRRRLAGGWARR